MNAQKTAQPIKRTDIVKWANCADAFTSLNNYARQHFVFMGDATDSRPFWVVDAKTATKLAASGYERA